MKMIKTACKICGEFRYCMYVGYRDHQDVICCECMVIFANYMIGYINGMKVVETAVEGLDIAKYDAEVDIQIVLDMKKSEAGPSPI